ncbi:hypothetical protein [Brevibacterium sp. VCM10]|nr:hypothetical protein [Brevibacterium sp. VCM10]
MSKLGLRDRTQIVVAADDSGLVVAGNWAARLGEGRVRGTPAR